METITIELKKADLIKIHKQLTPCMSKEQTRDYLCGVCLDYSNGELKAVATNGHLLGKITFKDIAVKSDSDFNVILPAALIKKLSIIKMLKSETQPLEGEYDATITIEGLNVSIECDGNSFSDGLIEGIFPDYERAIPDLTDPAVEISFSPAYLMQVAKAAKDVGEVCIKFTIKDGTTAMRIDLQNEEGMFVLMPMEF